MSKFVLAVEDTVEVQVKFSVKSKGVLKAFSVTLEADRLSQSEVNETFDNKEQKVTDFLMKVVKGWSGQRLVLDSDGNPAEFSTEALEAFFSVAGVAGLCFNAYFKECGAKEKN